MNILVTGIASDIGFNCGRILRELDGFAALHGVDTHDDHAGTCLFDACAIAPRAADAAYEGWLTDYVARHQISLVLPTSEAEIAAIDASDMPSRISARFAIANRSVIHNAIDKHTCLTFLEKQGIAVPAHGLVGGAEPTTWPVIVKPRAGQGSKGLIVAENAEDYRRSAPDGNVWQEQLLPAEEEYTCAVYRSPTAGTRILLLRRTLQGGLTGKGEVVADEEMSRYVTAITEALDLCGAMNVQLRRTDGGPRLFEINPRLSSTVMFRHRLGFRDLEWWLMELADRSISDYRAIAPGTRFYRGSQEYIVR